MSGILTTLVLLPLAGGVAALMVGRGRDALVRQLALGVSLVTFALSVVLWMKFNPGSADYQFVERHSWLPEFGISYHVGVDGISLLLIILTTFLTPLALLCSWESIESRVREFAFFMLALEAAMIGVFISIDLFLFYLFWDAMLIPMYFLIGIWGYDRRIYAAIKFILYTLAGSVLMLVAILWLASFHQAQTGVPSFDLADLMALSIPGGLQTWLFLAFAVAFAIKVPIFPFHTWLPDAHVEAPTAGSVILAGVLLKMGTYGLLRFAFPLFPEAARLFAPYLATLAVVGIVYGALVAMVQPDLKKLVAYSSVSHLGFVVLGICALTVNGVQGSVFQMVAHGISTGGLFLIVGMLSDRRHTRQIAEFGGLKAVMPRLVAAFFLVTLASIALPGMNGFVGEFLILLGTFASPFSVHARLYTAVAAIGVILSAVYMLWMFQRVNYGTVTNPKNRALRDLSLREWFVIGPVCAVAIVMGVAPNAFLKPMEPAVRRVVEHIRGTSLPMNAARQPTAAAGVRGSGGAAMTQTDFAAIAPMLIVTLAACATLLAEAFRSGDERMPFELLGLIGLSGAIAASVLQWHQEKIGFGVIVIDHYSIFFNVTIAGIGVLTTLLSVGAAERDQLPVAEYYALMLFSIAGMMLMASTRDLLLIFIALEILSLGVYVLTGLRRTSEAGAEAAFKYFVLGSFSSAVFLYGIALAYAVSGTTRLDELGLQVAGAALNPDLVLILAMVFLLVGFGFKVSAVPFHMWTPDAYQGAPTLVTGFMSTGVKAAAFAAFARVFLSALEPLRVDWMPVLSAIAGLTMIVGTVVGVAQTSVKRMLAYSSIAHAGYLLVGLVAASSAGKAAILFYLVAYAATNLGAFGVLAALSTPDWTHDDVRDFAGLGKDRPGLAALLTVFLLSLGGFPPTVGFVAKWYIFNAAIQQNLISLAILGVLTSVVSVFFYLRIVVMMYMVEEKAPGRRPAVPPVAMAGMVLALAAVFYLGVLPGTLLRVAVDSVASIF